MSADILNFTGQTVGPVSASDVLEGAQSADLREVIIIGIDGGAKLYFASSTGDITLDLYLAEKFKHMLLGLERDGQGEKT